MVITSIKEQKNNKEKYNVFIDGNFSFSASAEDIIKHSLKTGLIIKENELNDLIEECELSKAYKYGLSLLERKDYTIFEMENKLKSKEYSENTIAKVINKVKEYGFLNDTRYTERFIKDGLNIKKHGIRRIKHDLNRKGIDKEEINQIELDDEIEYQNAMLLAEKKYKQIIGKEKIREKLFRYLVGRGYEYEVVTKVINKLLKGEENFFSD